MDWLPWIKLGGILSCLSLIYGKFPYRTYDRRRHISPNSIHRQLPRRYHSTKFDRSWKKSRNVDYLKHFDNYNLHSKRSLALGLSRRKSRRPEVPNQFFDRNSYFYGYAPRTVSYRKRYKEFDVLEAFDDLFLSTEAIYDYKDSCKQNKTSYASMMDYANFWSIEDNSCRKKKKKKRRYKRDGGCRTCCETVWSADSPFVVEYKGKNYKVVTPPSGYQIVFQGKCKKNARCVCGECVEENTYFTWVLVVDPDLDYFPPVKFVPVKYSRMCQCVNRG